MNDETHDDERAPLRPIVVLNIGFWIGVTLILWLFGVALGGETLALTLRRGLMALVGFGFTFGMSLALVRFRGRPFAWQALLAVAVSAPAAVAYYAVAYYVFYIWGASEPMPFMIGQFVRSAYFWIASFFGWASLFVAFLYSLAVRDRERRLAAVQALAFDAQMQALRYQINPHFLFNTLNSIAEMVAAREVEKAEAMVLSLSNFLRSTLTLDPLSDLPLEEELRLQSRYLAIEQERFKDRLSVSLECPPALGGARVPALLLQPLMENAIKYGVGVVEDAVAIGLRAEARGRDLVLTIGNDAREDGVRTPGLGVGLKNVRARLAARYGAAAELTAGFIGPRRFEVTVRLPLVTT